DVQKLYKVFLGAAVFLCVLFSIVNAKMLYRAKVSDADDGDDLRSYFSVGSAFFALLFASFILSLYLIISHTQQGYLNSILSERNLNFVVQMYLYFYFLVGAIIFASKRYAKYVFTPWIYSLIAGGKYFLLFSVLMVLYVGFWLLVFNQFLQGLSTHQLDQAVSKLFLYAMVKVIMNIADSVVVVFEYADDLASAMYHFVVLVWSGCKIIIVTVFKKIKENVGVTIGLLLAALAILKFKDVANFGSQSSKKLTGFMHGAGGVVTKSLVLVGFVAIGYGLFKAVKLIDAGKFPLQFEINWKVEPQDIYQVAVDCRHSQVQMVDYSDVGIVAHNDCRFSFPSDENHCDWQAVVALENFVGVGDNRSTLDSARQRGVAVINQFLIEYRKECNDQHGKPKLFVLNIGSPKKASQPPRDELSSEVFLTRYGASELQLRKLLQSRVSADEFQYWKLVDVSQELY
nr:hypothetical protein [Cellvibrionaceae bacterium]